MIATMSRLRPLARWAAVLAGVLTVGTSAPARAAIDVFVDSGGVCAGKTPCFTTIQAGVNNAGPPPAAVFVFAGTYNESVDLGLMGSALIGGSAGNLMLRSVDSTGVPNQGGVSVLPAAGAALRNSLLPFPGSITIDGFTVKSPDDSGIALGSVMGSIFLADVVSDDNATAGFTASIGAGDVSIVKSSFSNNLGGNGIAFATALGVNFEDVTADGNANAGASFSVASGVVGATRSSFSGNKNGPGVSFANASGVIFDHVTADENQNAGADFSVTGSVRVSQSSFSRAKNGPGLIFSSATDVSFDVVTADDNQNAGANFSLSGDLRISRSSFSGAKNGEGLIFSLASDVTMIQVTADANENAGANFSMKGVLRIIRSSFSAAANGPGLIFSTPSQVIFEQVSADGNQNEGANFTADGPVNIASSSFNNAVNANGLSVNSATNLVLLGIVASGNSIDGVAASVNSARISGSRFEHNGRNGLLLRSEQEGGDFQLTCNDFVGNLTGLRVDSDLLINAPHNYWGSPTGPTHPSNPGGTGDTIVDGANGGAGTVVFAPFLTVPSALSPVCRGHGAPLMQTPELALLLLGLLILPAWRLKRRAARSRS